MSTTQQPEATRLVDKYEIEGFLQDHRFAQNEWCRQAVAELRRLHAENQDLRARVQELGEMARENRSKRVIELEQRIAEMEEQMAAIGAGGVESLRKRAAPAVVAVQEETHVDNLFDAVLNCPHAITAESVTLHFYPKQEGHTALTQLRHRLAAADMAARQRELQLLSEIEALERLALANLKQQGSEVAPQAVQAAVPEAIEQMAADRYKVVPSHESVFHRWAVVADNGAQQLYIGREGECQNMARKFMGAFLDGAFVAMQNAAPPHPTEGFPSSPEDALDADRWMGMCKAIFGDEDHVLVPRGLIGAACYAIDKKRDGTKTLAELRRYTTGDLSAAIIMQREADARDAARSAPAAPVPQGWKLVPVELLERIQESLGSFVSDQGWSQSDIDTADALDGLLAAAPHPPEAAQLDDTNVADTHQDIDLKGEV